MTALRLHVRDELDPERTRCGRRADRLALVVAIEDATCVACGWRMAGRGARRAAMDEALRREAVAMSGTGVLKCRACGQPYRDHPWPVLDLCDGRVQGGEE